jgi:hypothetical protein
MIFVEFTNSRGSTPFQVGDPVIITGAVKFQGKTGDVREIGQDGAFVVVNLYNHGPYSFHTSDVEYNDYADSEDVDEGSYDPDAYINPRVSRDYGLSGLSWQGSSFGGGGGEPDPIKPTEPLSVGRPRKPRGTSAQLPADPFGRTTGKIPKGTRGQTFSQGTPDERLGDKKYALEANREQVGNMDADRFDDAMARLKKLAGAGPLKTVYDPQKRVYRNVPTAVQPTTQPKK